MNKASLLERVRFCYSVALLEVFYLSARRRLAGHARDTSPLREPVRRGRLARTV